MSTDQTQEEIEKALQDAANRPQMAFNNEGDTYVINRAARRSKPRRRTVRLIDRIVALENYTKSTHQDKKRRSKNAKRSEYRKRAAARAAKNN